MREYSTWVKDRNKKGHIEEDRIDRFTIPLVNLPPNPGSPAWRETSSQWEKET